MCILIIPSFFLAQEIDQFVLSWLPIKVEDLEDFWNRLDNKNDNFVSADQNKSYGSNDDMVESDKVLWRYEDLLDKLLGK